MNKEVRPFEEYKEIIQNMSKDDMIKGLYDLSANIIEKDKEIERLNKDLDTAIEICNNRQKEIVKLNNIINELEKELDKGFEVYICNGRKAGKSIELGYKICQKELFRKLKELKEKSDNND